MTNAITTTPIQNPSIQERAISSSLQRAFWFWKNASEAAWPVFNDLKIFIGYTFFTIMVHPTTLNKVCQVLYFVVARYTPSQSLGKSAFSN